MGSYEHLPLPEYRCDLNKQKNKKGITAKIFWK